MGGQANNFSRKKSHHDIWWISHLPPNAQWSKTELFSHIWWKVSLLTHSRVWPIHVKKLHYVWMILRKMIRFQWMAAHIKCFSFINSFPIKCFANVSSISKYNIICLSIYRDQLIQTIINFDYYQSITQYLW